MSWNFQSFQMFEHYIMLTDLMLLYGFGVQCLDCLLCESFYLYQWIHVVPVESICEILSLADISMCIYMSYMLCTR